MTACEAWPEKNCTLHAKGSSCSPASNIFIGTITWRPFSYELEQLWGWAFSAWWSGSLQKRNATVTEIAHRQACSGSWGTLPPQEVVTETGARTDTRPAQMLPPKALPWSTEEVALGPSPAEGQRGCSEAFWSNRCAVSPKSCPHLLPSCSVPQGSLHVSRKRCGKVCQMSGSCYIYLWVTRPPINQGWAANKPSCTVLCQPFACLGKI